MLRLAVGRRWTPFGLPPNPGRKGLLTALCLGLLAGCATEPTQDRADPASAVEAAPFDQGRSAALLAEAQAAGQSGEALALYREAALAWPDNLNAWRGLSAAASESQERAAAEFMVERVTLYPSDSLYVQREINRALDAWIAEQRALPEANAIQIGYADALSSFYEWRYASRGQYDPPRPFFNVEARDLPAVIVSAGGVLGYVGSVALGASEGTTE